MTKHGKRTIRRCSSHRTAVAATCRHRKGCAAKRVCARGELLRRFRDGRVAEPRQTAASPGSQRGPIGIGAADPGRPHHLPRLLRARRPRSRPADRPRNTLRTRLGDENVHRSRGRRPSISGPTDPRQSDCRPPTAPGTAHHTAPERHRRPPAPAHVRDRRLRRGGRHVLHLPGRLRLPVAGAAQLPHAAAPGLPAPLRRPAALPTARPVVAVLQRGLHPARDRPRTRHRQDVRRPGPRPRLRPRRNARQRLLPTGRTPPRRGRRLPRPRSPPAPSAAPTSTRFRSSAAPTAAPSAP